MENAKSMLTDKCIWTCEAETLDVHRAGQHVTLQIEAASRSLLIYQEGTLLKTVPLRGFSGGSCSFARFVEYMIQQARALHRLRSLQDRKKRVS